MRRNSQNDLTIKDAFMFAAVMSDAAAVCTAVGKSTC